MIVITNCKNYEKYGYGGHLLFKNVDDNPGPNSEF